MRRLGLRVEPRGPAHSWGAGWSDHETPWARAPGRDGAHCLLPLDAPADSDRAATWVGDALACGLAWQRYQDAYAGTVTGDLATLHAILADVRPSYDLARAVLRAVVAEAGLAVPAPVERLATAAEAAHVLGIDELAMRRAIARGDVRTVRRGARRMVPLAEIERLMAEGWR